MEERASMLSRAAFTTFFFSLAASLILFGCAGTGKTVVWQARNVSFDKYTAFEIQPVFNATGKSFSEREDIPAVLTAHLKGNFEGKNLRINDSPQIIKGILVVQTDLLVYEPYVPRRDFRRYWVQGEGETRCTLTTRLVDKETNHVVAEIATAKVAGAGGAYNVPSGPSVINDRAHEKVLKDAARDIAEAVSIIVPPENSL